MKYRRNADIHHFFVKKGSFVYYRSYAYTISAMIFKTASFIL
ncbi:hypothetical protein HMPREF9406_2395 [Clostridium sp. HGF2]|nr:hypothetical protein HMPREF9406_2395 [Clostridium sp. HGF2]